MAKVFDTYASSQAFDAFISDSGNEFLEMNYIVVAACKDDCISHLSLKGKTWFKNLGSTEIEYVRYRYAFVFIGQRESGIVNEKRALSIEDEVCAT